MADTIFTEATPTTPGTVVHASWLNDANTDTYNTLSNVVGTNSITATGPVSFTTYNTSTWFKFLPAGNNTGAVTLNINGLGAIPVTKSGTTPLITGDLIIGVLVTLYFDGTRFQLTNPNTLSVANGGTGATTAAAARDNLGIGQSISFRNRLINALGVVNQRAYPSGTATTTANQYTVDRWRVVTLGQNLTYSTTANGSTMTAPAGGLEQVIEGNNIEGGVYTLSWTGTATATVNGTSITNGGNTPSLSAGTNVTIRFTGGTVYRPQFEFGTVITPFELRPFGYELSMCQRYYEVGVGNQGGVGSVAVGNQYSIPFKVTKRVAPTINYSATSTVNVSTFDFRTPTTDQITQFSTCTASAGYVFTGNWFATAEL